MADYTDFWGMVDKIKALPRDDAARALVKFVDEWKRSVGRDIHSTLTDGYGRQVPMTNGELMLRIKANSGFTPNG